MKPLALTFLPIAIFVSVIPVHARSTPTFDPVDCPMPIPAGATVVCGEYQVPENRSNPNGRMIRMPFAILHSQNPNPMPDPIVFVSSGDQAAVRSTAGGILIFFDGFDSSRRRSMWMKIRASFSAPKVEPVSRSFSTLDRWNIG